MKVIEHLQQSKKTLFSIEVLPPLKGKSIQSIFKVIDPLMEFKPPFVDVTYHREEFVYKKRDGGYLEKISIRKRPGTVGICAAIMNHYKVDAVPHIICGGFTKEETENALIDLNFLGIDNVLLLRGDSEKHEPHFAPEPGGHSYAIELVNQVVNMNHGVFLDDDLKGVEPTSFCIGVAGYPEKHFEAPNLNADITNLKKKVDAGADYIVTQMFFDNEKFYNFVKKCRDAGISVPIIPGIKPLSTQKQLALLPKTFHIDIPEALYKEIEKCTDDSAVKSLGIEWATQQSKELIKFGIPCLHFYTMGNPENIKQIASHVF